MRRRILLCAAAVSAIVTLAAVLLFNAPGPPAAAAAPGPTISVGTPSLVSGQIRVPISTSGAVPNAYSGFNLEMIWDANVLTFSGVDKTGAIPAVTTFCPPPDTTTFQPNYGTNVSYGCTGLGTSTTSTGLLVTVIFTPNGPGCTTLHLVTQAESTTATGNPDASTYTINFADNTKQMNTLVDGTASNLGVVCTPAGSPTATPTPSNTATPSPTPTNTPSPTPTNTPVSGAPDVTVSAVSVPTSVDSGTMVAYSTTVTNAGDAAAAGVTLDMTLPPGAVPFKNTYCKTYVPGHFSCKLPDLAAHAQIAVIFNVQAPIKTSSLLTMIVFTVAAANEPAGNAGNNTAQLTTYIRGCPDLNGDNVVNILDFTLAAQSYGLHQGQPGYNPLADQNGDNIVNILDLSIMANRYGNTCKGLDSDQDGLSNYDEINVYHTNPNNPDTDGDGLLDGVEVLTYGSNPLVADTSGDGYTDGQKAALGTDPTNYCPIMRADVNMDHLVNILDFSTASFSYKLSMGDPGYNPRVDQNADGTINILDFSVMAGSYGKNVFQCP